MSLTNAKLKLEYPSAENENTVDSPATTQPTTQPAKPRIRLWTKQSTETRNPASINLSGNQSGDFVPPGVHGKDAVKKLFGTSDTATLYVEGLTPSTQPADARILATLYPDGSTDAGARKMEDAVRMTAIGGAIQMVWEEDGYCNQVPNPKQTVHKKRLYVVTENTSEKAEIVVKSNIQPTALKGRLHCAVLDGTTRLASSTFNANGLCYLKFTPTGPDKNYLLNLVFDSNGNGTLDPSETSGMTTEFDVTAFTSALYNSNRDSLNFKASYAPYQLGSNLLKIFLNRSDLTLPFSQNLTIDINCFQQGNLTHNTGEDFANSGNGTVRHYTWNAKDVNSNESLMSTLIGSSNEMRALITQIGHWDQVKAYFTANPGATDYTATWTYNNVPINFDSNDMLDLTGYDLHIAIGHATIPAITITILVKKDFFNRLYCDSLITTGSIIDLYDFNYEDGGLAATAATLQIGWEKNVSGRDAGRIFFDTFFFEHRHYNFIVP